MGKNKYITVFAHVHMHKHLQTQCTQELLFFFPLPLQNICCVVYYLTCVFLSLAVGLAGLQITWVFWIFVSVVCSQSERVSQADLHRWTKKKFRLGVIHCGL